MFVLLTNDDGIRAPGLVATHGALTRAGHEVQVVAPELVQSASGHGITLTTPLMTRQVNVQDKFIGTSVEGRPADCVKLAINKIVDRKPDLVISGMNEGANVGINVIYSGTVAAAIEAAFLGLPAIALSLYLRREIDMDFDHAADIAINVADQVAAYLDPGQIVSINVPPLASGVKPRGVKVCRQCTAPWIDEYERRLNPRGEAYYWNTSVFKLNPTQDDTDVAALRDGYVTVTPLQFDLTSHKLLSVFEGKLKL